MQGSSVHRNGQVARLGPVQLQGKAIPQLLAQRHRLIFVLGILIGRGGSVGHKHQSLRGMINVGGNHLVGGKPARRENGDAAGIGRTSDGGFIPPALNLREVVDAQLKPEGIVAVQRIDQIRQPVQNGIDPGFGIFGCFGRIGIGHMNHAVLVGQGTVEPAEIGCFEEGSPLRQLGAARGMAGKYGFAGKEQIALGIPRLLAGNLYPEGGINVRAVKGKRQTLDGNCNFRNMPGYGYAGSLDSGYGAGRAIHRPLGKADRKIDLCRPPGFQRQPKRFLLQIPGRAIPQPAAAALGNGQFGLRLSIHNDVPHRQEDLCRRDICGQGQQRVYIHLIHHRDRVVGVQHLGLLPFRHRSSADNVHHVGTDGSGKLANTGYILKKSHMDAIHIYLQAILYRPKQVKMKGIACLLVERNRRQRRIVGAGAEKRQTLILDIINL